MQSFIALNKHKLFFIFTRIGAAFILFFLTIILITTLANNDYPDLEGFIAIILTAGLVVPIFIITISYFGWLYNRRLRMKLLRVTPFDKLDTIGFRVVYCDRKSKWAYTEETMGAEINGYRIELYTNAGAPKTLAFKAFVSNVLDNPLDGLMRRYKKEEIDFDLDSIIRKYYVMQSKELTIQQLQRGLNEFVERLSEEGFVSTTD